MSHESFSCFRVTDVNDNAPQFLGAPYSLNISELAMVGSNLITVEAVDADQRGPFSTVEYSIERWGGRGGGLYW